MQHQGRARPARAGTRFTVLGGRSRRAAQLRSTAATLDTIAARGAWVVHHGVVDVLTASNEATRSVAWAALDAQLVSLDQEVVAAWPSLPHDIAAGVDRVATSAASLRAAMTSAYRVLGVQAVDREAADRLAIALVRDVLGRRDEMAGTLDRLADQRARTKSTSSSGGSAPDTRKPWARSQPSPTSTAS